jgi:4'-phosphopantetheinyl transferase N-terminal domain
MLVTVFDRPGLDGREDLLTRAERRCLVKARFGARRRTEWVAGRVAIRRALGRLLGDDAGLVSVTCASNGAPRALGRPDLAISLSHDGAWVAVATARRPARGRVGIDLCDARHHDRVRRLLDRLSIDAIGAPLSPCATWAALECALKLRGLGIASLLDARLVLSQVAPHTAQISGLGASATVTLAETEQFALAWAEEA